MIMVTKLSAQVLVTTIIHLWDQQEFDRVLGRLRWRGRVGRDAGMYLLTMTRVHTGLRPLQTTGHRPTIPET